MCVQANVPATPDAPHVVTSGFLLELIALSNSNRLGRQLIRRFLNITMDYWRLNFDPSTVTRKGPAKSRPRAGYS